MESFVAPDVDYKYNIIKWKALHDCKQLQCFCGIPVKKPNLQADICACDRCGLSLSVRAIQEGLKHNIFIKWPCMQLPVCKACNQTGLRAYGKEAKCLTFVCKCSKPNYFRVTDGNADCWSGFIDINRAGNMHFDSSIKVDGVAVPIREAPKDMF